VPPTGQWPTVEPIGLSGPLFLALISELTVRTLLVNHGRIKRESLDDELETEAATADA